ncbi:Proteasome alpha-subunit, N-terminal domain [Sesbania bispinosa]|nr:Proteasome alpha-subunit, N-terminal domain [Sesbania bispinosa]
MGRFMKFKDKYEISSSYDGLTSTGVEYSFSLTTFSPSGMLVQIEHALTAVGPGQTFLGIKVANGVIIATEKKLPSILVDEATIYSDS